MSTKSSTRVFQIYELAELITRFTIQGQLHGRLQGQETLAVLARVDKNLSEISLRELWKVLHSGKPLVSLLPLDFVNHVEPAVAKQRLSREILITELGAPKVKARDLERYMKYSAYVHVLNIWADPSATYELLKKADRCIVQLGLHASCFGRRETLNISSSWTMDSQEYREMRSNRAIKHLSISPSQAIESPEYQEMGSNRAIKNLAVVLQNTVQGPWIEEISRYYSGISSLAIVSLRLDRVVNALNPESITVLDSLKCLQVLLVDIEPTAITGLLRKVRNLPLLKELTLKFPGPATESDISLDDLALEPPSQPLKVSRLNYEGQARSNFHAILNASKALSIRYERIDYLYTPFSFQQDMAMVLQWIISTQPSIQAVVLSDRRKPIQTLVDELRRTNQEVLARLIILPQIISQLAGLRQLRRLKLNTFNGSFLTPALLDIFASSLTLLETCIFTPYRIVDGHGNSGIVVCLIHIINFILRCSNLRHLAACFDGRKVRHISLASEFVTNGSQFSVLDVGHSVIDDAEYAASTLQKSLPALRQVIPGERNLHVSYIMTEVEEILWCNVGRIIGGTAPGTSV